MDTFFQKLRDIQKKERTTGTLSEVDDSFYTDASNYLQELLKMVNNNPLSLEAYQLRDAQRIITEISERREFKIVSTAATNVQKAHDLFKGHKEGSELYDVIPYNTTPEEEEFYRKIVDMMIKHREELMDKIIINKQSNETKIGFKPSKAKVQQKPADNIQDSKEIETNKEESLIKDDSKKPLKPKTPLLDEDQIAMMFGQAPEDILLDENNNPVKPVKKDITTPFKGPKPPKEDTVSLQNESPNESKKPDEEKSDINEEQSENTPEDKKENKPLDTTDEVHYGDLKLVEFKQEISTDILDENEKTYGPFLVKDIVLLPKSIVEILNINNVINILD